MKIIKHHLIKKVWNQLILLMKEGVGEHARKGKRLGDKRDILPPTITKIMDLP